MLNMIYIRIYMYVHIITYCGGKGHEFEGEQDVVCEQWMEKNEVKNVIT